MKKMEKIRFVNLTPHEIVVFKGNEIVAKFPPSGTVARLEAVTKKVDEISGIPITSTKYGNIKGVPQKQKNTFLIVSDLIKNALPNRDDLLIPNQSIWDENGRIIGCRSFAINI